MRVGDASTGKSTTGLDKFGSVIDRMNMKLESKLFDISSSFKLLYLFKPNSLNLGGG
jgi:hypothetical protein